MDTVNDIQNVTPWWRKWWVLTIIGVVILGLVLVVILFATQNQSLRFSIEFKDVSGLEIGDGIFLNGIQVGEVTKIDLASEGGKILVEVKIDPEYRSQMHQASVFQLVTSTSEGAAPSLEISMKVIDITSPEIEPDQILPGASDDVSSFLQILEYKGTSVVDKVKQWIDDYLRLGDLKINTEYTGEEINRAFILESGKYIPQDILFSAVLPSDPAWTRTDTSTDQARVITTLGTFELPSEASWNGSTLQFSSEWKVFWRDYTYAETFPAGSFSHSDAEEVDFTSVILEAVTFCIVLDEDACTEKVWEAIGPLLEQSKSAFSKKLDIQYTVVMPGKIIETTADSYQGDTAVWEFTGATLDEGLTVSIQSRRLDAITISVAAILLVGMIIVVVLFLRKVIIPKDKTI